MLKFLKARFIIILAAIFLVSMGSVFASNNVDNSKVKWRFEIGRDSVRYGTKYTFVIEKEIYEFFIPYKESVGVDKTEKEAKFIGHYWGMKNKEEDFELNNNYIYPKDKIEIIRKDVIEFLKIKDEKLVAKIEGGYEFYLFVEPYYSYKRNKWGEVYISTLRELYSMLPESKEGILPYKNARDEKGKIIKSKITGIESFREMIVKAMNQLEEKNNGFDEYKNVYLNKINNEMLDNGWLGYHFEEEIQTGEFIKIIVETLWPDYIYKEPSAGNHWTLPYMRTMDELILDKEDFSNERLSKRITRAEAAELIYRFAKLMHRGDLKYSLNKESNYIEILKDKSDIKNEEEKLYIENCLRLGLMNVFSDRTFKPFEGMSKEEATNMIFNACR